MAALVLTGWGGVASAADGQNEALLKLLQVLRDRGSITAAEYEEIRLVATASPAPAAPASAPAPAPAPVAASAAAQAPATADIGPAVSKALAGKWYEKIGFRGYSQLRYSDVLSQAGLPVEVPADKSVNPNESFILRRGRVVFSGDATERLNLYAQMDFNGSTGAADYSLQMRDLYADVALDRQKAWRIRLGQSKVPFGFVNMQSSQNRAPLERPDALNTAVEGERDLGASLLWASPEARKRFRDLTGLGLKGSGDYGVVAVGVYGGQGLNRSDQNHQVHVFGRVQYPFKLANGHYFELGVQGYRGRFVSPTQAITTGGATFTPTQRAGGELDERVAGTFVWYPQPIGLEAEWNVGRTPALSADLRTIGNDTLHGGYVQVHYRQRNGIGTWFPFARWNYYDGARKFARNAPRETVNEIDFGLEFARWAEVELTGMYSHTFTRTRTGSFPYGNATKGNRVGVQVQWNY